MSKQEKLNYLQLHIENYETQLFKCNTILQAIDEGLISPNSVEGKDNLANKQRLLNFACFSISCFLDIAISLKGLILAQTRWERIFFLRNGFVIIRECVKTYQEYQKEIMMLIANNDKCKESLAKLNNKLKQFKTEHHFDSVIIPFRNKAGAHYDKNFSIYFDKLTEIEASENVKTISDFSNFQTQLINFLDEVIDYMLEKR